MTVKELREFLAEFPDNALVVMAKDAEGNDYSPLSEAYQGRYVAKNGWSGEFTSEEEATEGETALVLWPTN